jgi:hypothetical protein
MKNLPPLVAALVVAGLAAIGGAGFVFAGYDDSPGGQLIGLILIVIAVVLGTRAGRPAA